MMEIGYDPSTDAMYIRLRSGECEISEEVSEGIIVDYDKERRVICIEVLDVKVRGGVAPAEDFAFRLLGGIFSREEATERS